MKTAFALSLCGALMLASPAMAQEKKAEKAAAKPVAGKNTVTVLADNDRVRVTEAIFKPGDQGENIERPMRVTRALKGGTLERTYPDGKKETVVWKTGEVKIQGPDKPFVPKNVGKSDVHLYIVSVKK